MGFCIECMMTWLMFGNGAECLAGHGRVYKNTSWKFTEDLLFCKDTNS